jgi:glycosyltransferase involved in cell wall biosynthesis
MHKPSPLVCICLPTFNVENTIDATLRSLLNQTYKNFNILVVDNCSDDNTVGVVSSFEDSRVKVIRNLKNLGSEGNFTKCIQEAYGEYTAIYHADDIYHPEIISQQVAFLERHPHASAVFTEADVIDHQGKIFGHILIPSDIRQKGPIYNFREIFRSILKNSNFLICPSAMVRTAVYKQKIVSWRSWLFKSSADLDVWLRILLQGPIGILPARLMRYRVSSVQGSAKVRLAVDRSDFLMVLDFYMATDEVKCFILKSDLRNQRALERRDQIMRSINLLISGRQDDAINTAPSLVDPELWKCSFSSTKSFLVLTGTIILRLSITLGFGKIAAIFFQETKKIMVK